MLDFIANLFVMVILIGCRWDEELCPPMGGSYIPVFLASVGYSLSLGSPHWYICQLSNTTLALWHFYHHCHTYLYLHIPYNHLVRHQQVSHCFSLTQFHSAYTCCTLVNSQYIGSWYCWFQGSCSFPVALQCSVNTDG